MPNAARLGVLACVLAAAITTAVVIGPEPVVGAQQSTPQQASPPVFRGGTTFVSVDAYPRRDGQVIEGLTTTDFEVLEDGVPQAVETFQFIRIDPNPTDADRRDPNSGADSNRQAADPRNRVFVVYLDMRHTTVAGSHYARQPVLDFLTRTIGTNDLFGVLTAEVPVGQLVFGRRTETLEAELLKYWPWGQADRAGTGTEVRTPLERRLAACEVQMPAGSPGAPLIALSREDLLMTSLEHLVLRLGALRDERKNVLFVSEGWVPRGPRRELLNVSVSGGERPGIGVGPGGRIGIGQTMQPFMQDAAWCDSEIARLASIDFEVRFRNLLTSANRANVSFYPVDVGGLRTTVTRATDTLRTMAENTDGFAIVSTNDLTGGVRRITNDLSAFYLLGYYSSNPAANGRFREIEVKVKQPDVRVSARRGYLAPTVEMLAAAAAPRVNTGPSAVDAALAGLASSRTDTEMFVAGTATADGLHVAVELSPAVAGRSGWREGASLTAVATRSDGVNASTTATITKGERAASLLIPLTSDNRDGTWQVVVQASGTDQRLEQRVEVSTHAPRLVWPGIGWRAAASPRAPLRPLADARITRLERLRVEWSIADSTATHTARLLDRSGKALGQPLPLTPPGPTRESLTLDLPMGSLPEGEYVVELVATRGDDAERRLLAFRVVR